MCQRAAEFIQSFTQEQFSSGLPLFQSRLEMDGLPVGRGGGGGGAYKREGQSVKAQHLCGRDLADSAIRHFCGRHREAVLHSHTMRRASFAHVTRCSIVRALIVTCADVIHHVGPQSGNERESSGSFVQIWMVNH